MLLKDFLIINPKEKLNKGKNYPYVEMADIAIGNRYVFSNNTRDYKGGGSRFKNGDVLFARITPCLENGKIAQYKNNKCLEAFGSTEFVIFRNRNGISDPSFLYYLANSALIRVPAEKSMFGASGRQRIDINVLENLEIPEYSLGDQKKIAQTLSSFDDLIAINLKRITIFKKIIQELYSEWFVKYNFSRLDDLEIVSKKFGRIPKEWGFKNLGDISKITMGQSPKSIYYNERGKGLPFHQGVTNFGEFFPITKKFSTKGNRTADVGDILFSVRAPVGRMNIAKTKIILGRGLCGIRSLTGHQTFLYSQLKRIFHEEDIIGGGTIFKSVTKKDMHDIKVIYPELKLIDRFEELTKPMLFQIMNLTNKNILLQNTRNLLLPKLISGGGN